MACPTGKVPLGGGVFFSSVSVSAGINSSYPTGTGWAADVNNGSTSASSFFVYAVCGKQPKKYAVAAGTPSAVAPGTQKANITATCPKGKPLSGGLFSDTFNLLANDNSSFPTTNGWRIDANNGSTGIDNVRAYVVCGQVITRHVVVAAAVSNTAGTQTGSTALCGTGVPVGGGAFSNSGSTAVTMNTSYPVAGGWRAYMNNGSASTELFNTYVVCSG